MTAKLMPMLSAIQAATGNHPHACQKRRLAACAELYVGCSHLVPLLAASAAPCAREGALQMVDALVKGLGTAVVPYLLLLVVPVMGRMSDPVATVRQPATATFAPIVALLPLAQVTCPGLLSWHQYQLCTVQCPVEMPSETSTFLTTKLPSELCVVASMLCVAASHAFWLLSQLRLTDILTGNRLTKICQQLLPHVT